MEGFQTNPVVFVAICFGWLIIIASFGAYKAFFKDPEIPKDDAAEVSPTTESAK